MKLLDLFCGAGGAAIGYSRAGFDEIVGVDNRPMPRYPFAFVLGDALEYCREHGAEFDAIHASPPCQFGSVLTPMAYRPHHPNLIPQTRQALIESGTPYIIENVPNVRRHLINPVMLCGSMFGLGVWRHRFFELSFGFFITPSCDHSNVPILISGTRSRDNERYEHTAQQCRDASGLSWMTRMEMDQAIPPAYTEYIGRYLIAHIESKRETV